MPSLRSAIGSKVGLFLAGLVLGALLLAVAPVGAHHNDGDFKDRLSTLENKVKKLNKKTSQLTADGEDYFGFVHMNSVWSSSNYGCTPGETAQWLDRGNGFVSLNCPGGTTSTGASAGAERFRR